MCKTGWRAQVKINAKGQSLRFMKMLTFFRYYAKRTTGKCFKNAIFQHDAGKAYWVIGLEFTSRWWIVCNILYIGHRNIWEFRAWKMYFLFFFRVQKSMFVHTSCTLLFFAQQNCEYTRVYAVRVFYSSDYEYTQLTLHRLEVKYILNNLLL